MNWKSWTLLASVLVVTSAAHFRYDSEAFPAFYFAFGVAGCLLMLFVTKVVAKKTLSRKEDYYERT